MKSLKPLVFIPFLCLTACNKLPKHCGVYSFRMGKEDEAHMGASIELTNDDYSIEEETVGKKFIAKFDGGNLDIDFEDLDLGLPEDIKEMIIEALKDIDVPGKLKEGVEGGYTIGDEDFKDGKRINLVFNVGGIPFDMDSLKELFLAYVNNKSITLQIPVSINDAIHELVWYGTYFELKPTNVDSIFPIDVEEIPEDILPGAKGEARYGTHPTDEEVATINKVGAPYFSRTHGYKLNAESELESTCKFYLDENGGLNAYFRDKSKYVAGTSEFTIFTKNEYNYYVDSLKCDVTLGEATEKGDYLFAKVTSIKDVVNHQDVPQDSYFQKAFTFRNFHDIKISLLKE